MPGATTGIGPALTEARTSRGISLEEASRDTKIKPSFLRALEGERFDALQGEVYVRGFLRSYSSYLGLDPEKVVSAYAGQEAAEPPSSRPVPPTRAERRGLRILHRRANYKLAVALAVVLIGVFAAVGMFRGRDSVEPVLPPEPSLADTSGPPVAPFVLVRMEALEPVHAVVTSDGTRLFDGMLRKGQPLELTAGTLLRVRFDRGVVSLRVNGHDLGVPGDPHRVYVASFTPSHFQETPSANA